MVIILETKSNQDLGSLPYQQTEFIQYYLLWCNKKSLIAVSTDSADKGWGGAGTNYRGPVVQKGAWGQTLLHMFLVFLGCIIICQLNKLTLSGQAQVTLLLKVSLSDLGLRFLASLPLLL